MECRTHIVVANTLSILLTRPDSIGGLVTCIGITTLASTISDIDVSEKKDKTYVLGFTIVSIISLLLLSFLELKYNIGIRNYINDNSSYLRLIVCFILGIITCYIGYLKPHRSFLHSFLGIGILTLLCYISLGGLVKYFIIGIVSHIILDLFNKKGLYLFYPLKNKYSLKLCVYNGKVNNILFIIFSILLIILVIYVIIFVE